MLLPWASWAGTQTWNNFDDFSKGHFENVLLLASGKLEVGYPLKTLTVDLPSAVTAMAMGPHSEIYVATSGPGQVWQIKPTQKPRLIFESGQPIISQLISMPNGELAILMGPQGGVNFVKPNTSQNARMVSIPEQLLGAYVQKDALYLVGNSNSLFTIKNYEVSKSPIVGTENQFRTVYKNYTGSAQSGTVYQDGKAIFKAAGETIAITEDKKGNLFAAFNTSPTSSQIWRISKKDPSCLVWESSKHLIYALAIQESKLFWGTGPNGQLFSSQPDCNAKPDILLSLQNRNRIMALAPQGSKLLIATAKTGALFELDLSQKANSGRFIAPIVKLDTPSKITESSDPIWLGNTPIPDNSWSSFEKDKNRQAQFVEPRVLVNAGKPVDKVSFSWQSGPH